jgi:hypothetical protein
MNSVRLSGLAASTLLFFLIAAFGLGMADSVQAQEKSKNEKIKELLQERLAVMRAMVKQAKAEYLSGRISVERVQHAMLGLVNARLELAASDKERFAVLEEAVSFARGVLPGARPDQCLPHPRPRQGTGGPMKSRWRNALALLPAVGVALRPLTWKKCLCPLDSVPWCRGHNEGRAKPAVARQYELFQRLMTNAVAVTAAI